jgi:large subunit ribosomal protein L6
MSRVGKHPVPIPEGVEVQLAGRTVTARGPLGSLSLAVDGEVTTAIVDHAIAVTPNGSSKQARAMWGTTRALIHNMVTGVSQGFTVTLEINGVGYRAAVQDRTLTLQLGYSHDVAFPIPNGVTIACERPTVITVRGADRQRVGQVAAEIRAWRPPEPYKGKGIRYATETVRRKEGKKK